MKDWHALGIIAALLMIASAIYSTRYPAASIFTAGTQIGLFAMALVIGFTAYAVLKNEK